MVFADKYSIMEDMQQPNQSLLALLVGEGCHRGLEIRWQVVWLPILLSCLIFPHAKEHKIASEEGPAKNREKSAASEKKAKVGG